MKTMLLFICITVLGAANYEAIAQTATKKTAAETKAQKDAEKLAKEFGLDAKQKEKVFAANLEFEKELEKLGKTKLTKEEKSLKKEALRQKQLTHLKTVLKPEQYEKVAAKLTGKPVKKSPSKNPSKTPKSKTGDKGNGKK